MSASGPPPVAALAIPLLPQPPSGARGGWGGGRGDRVGGGEQGACATPGPTTPPTP